jgi:hypothetical protein
MNATNAPIASVEEAKKQFATEIDKLEKAAYSAGQRSAVGQPPGTAKAERMADRARELQAATPGLSNIEATRRAYQEAGERLE